jgi:hypothetical protein
VPERDAHRRAEALGYTSPLDHSLLGNIVRFILPDYPWGAYTPVSSNDSHLGVNRCATPAVHPHALIGWLLLFGFEELRGVFI